MNPSSDTPRVPPLLAVSLGVLAASTSSLFIRFAQETGGSLVIAAYRLSIATLILAPFAIWRYRGELRALTRRGLALGLLSGMFLSLHFATWITSLEYTTVASSVVLVSTAPLWVALLAPVALREPVGRLVFVGLLVALIGSVVIGLSDSCRLVGGSLICPPLATFLGDQAFTGDLLALAGAWSAAGYMLIGRSLRQGMSLIAYIFLVYGIAALVLVAVVLASAQPAIGYPSDFYLWVLLLALIPQLLGHTSYNWALRYVPAAVVSITLLAEPVSATLLAYLFLSEVPSLLKLFGAILILAGVYLASRRGAAPQPAPETAPPAL